MSAPWQRRLALTLVYGALPVLLGLTQLDDRGGLLAAAADGLIGLYGVAALALLASRGGRDAYGDAFEHQQRSLSRGLSLLRRRA